MVWIQATDPVQADAGVAQRAACEHERLLFNAWVVRNGVQTLSMRIEVQPHNRALAPEQSLQNRPYLECVSCPGLKSLPLNKRATRRQWGMCGAVLPFDVNERNRAEALACTRPVIDSTQLMSSTTNLANR